VLDGLFDTLDPVLIVERRDGLALGQVAAFNEAAGEGKLRSLGIERNIGYRQIVGDAFAYCCPFRIESAHGSDVDQVDILDKIGQFIDPALDGHQAFYREHRLRIRRQRIGHATDRHILDVRRLRAQNGHDLVGFALHFERLQIVRHRQQVDLG
jgi:hypothetical protein